MKIIVLLSFSIFLLASVVQAQNNYTMHTLQQGETLSALAQQYSTTVGDIMRLNGMHADTKLVYGSAIKIPSPAAEHTTVAYTKTTPAQPITKAEITAAEPVSVSSTHVVQKGETLYSISKKYNVSITQLQIINKLHDLKVSLGQQLIIQQGTSVTTPLNRNMAPAATKAVVNNNQPQPPPPTTDAAVQEVNNQANDDAGNNDALLSQNADAGQPEFKPMGEGYFASQFSGKKLKKAEGVSMIFKTASGWGDGKYYILMNEADPGSIVKVTAQNGKSIYAKVLWNMGDLKENEGINFRISNAAATALDIKEDKFDINVSYGKHDAMN